MIPVAAQAQGREAARHFQPELEAEIAELDFGKAQVERCPSKAKVRGSNPLGRGTISMA
jgi:hypothetical protein